MASQIVRDYLTHLTVLAVLVLVLHIDPAVSIKGGTPGNKCDYPGLTVVVNPDGGVLCTGLRVGNNVIVPLKCKFLLENVIKTFPMKVKNSGFEWNLPVNFDLKGNNRLDGSYEFNLFGIVPGQDPDETTKGECFGSADIQQNFAKLFSDPFNGVLYDGSEPLDFSTCQLAGYGSATNDGAQYSEAGLRVTSVTKSTSAPCCAMMTDTLTGTEQGVGVLSTDYPFNCVNVVGSPCGLGDLGAPVMCKTTSAKTVTLGLVGSSPCVDNGLFLIHDLTGNSPNTKFGVTPIA